MLKIFFITLQIDSLKSTNKRYQDLQTVVNYGPSKQTHYKERYQMQTNIGQKLFIVLQRFLFQHLRHDGVISSPARLIQASSGRVATQLTVHG